MFKTEDIIGDIVFISFKSTKQLIDFGINSTTGHFLIKGYDSMGLWLEHPGIHILHMEDKNGNIWVGTREGSILKGSVYSHRLEIINFPIFIKKILFSNDVNIKIKIQIKRIFFEK